MVYGTSIAISEDLSDVRSPSILIMNHRTRLDWMFLWSYLIRKGNLNREKILLSNSHKHIPGFGKYVISGY